MPAGLNNRFNILQQSPHDFLSPEPEDSQTKGTEKWVPSRYNVRATAEDGRLVLWNTLSGKISVFKPEDRERVLNLLAEERL